MLQQIIVILGQVLASPLAQKIEACIISQSGWKNILSCILGVTAATPAEQTAKDNVVKHIEAHLAANP